MTTADMRLMCPNLKCRRILSVPQSARGKAVRCSHCGANIRVPESTAPRQPAAQ